MNIQNRAFFACLIKTLLYACCCTQDYLFKIFYFSSNLLLLIWCRHVSGLKYSRLLNGMVLLSLCNKKKINYSIDDVLWSHMNYSKYFECRWVIVWFRQTLFCSWLALIVSPSSTSCFHGDQSKKIQTE